MFIGRKYVVLVAHLRKMSVDSVSFKLVTAGLALQPAACAVRFGQQDAFAGDEKLAQPQTRTVQETATLSARTKHLGIGFLGIQERLAITGMTQGQLSGSFVRDDRTARRGHEAR